MSMMSFGWDEAIRPQRTMSATSAGSSPDLKRKRCERSEPSVASGPALSSPRRIKKQRASPLRASVPMRRRLEGLSHAQLFELVEQLCETNPEFHSQIARCAPAITVESALTSLKHYLVRALEALPFSADAKPSDYGYLRVQPLLHDFFAALADYTLALLPPNETSAHRSLEFLDGATELVHKVPEWDNQLNNLYKTRAYEDLNGAWAVAVTSLKGQIVRFDTEGRLQHHAAASGGRVQVQVPEPVLSVNGNNVLPVLGQVASM